ncbi:MAG: hypothetical protein HYV02_02625 [Deltaproteobacteria bacterium]|nr:hypothetical protein [Deltaproteobacteria bacterium]
MTQIDDNLKALCWEILMENVESERFSFLLIRTGIHLDTIEWDMANKILEKGDEIRNLISGHTHTVH